MGRVSLHHVQSEFFTGYDTPTDIGWLKIATPEKALVDVLYLRMTSLGDFKQLPEVNFPANFKWELARKFVRLAQVGVRRIVMLDALEELKTLARNSAK